MIPKIQTVIKALTLFPNRIEYVSAREYAISVATWLNENKVLSEALETLVPELNTIIQELNLSIEEIEQNKTTSTQAAESAAESLGAVQSLKENIENIAGTLIEGSINDAIIGNTSTFSSQYINSRISNMDNTADINKPVSELQQIEFDKKINITDILNDLTSLDTNKPLSAYQGKVLKDLIDNINTILTSDNSTLDSIQELVDYITQNRDSLSNLGISNIAGLGTALDGKAAVGHNHNSEYLAKTAQASDSYLLNGVHGNYYGGLNRGSSGADANTTLYPYVLSRLNTPNTTYYWHIRTQFYGSISSGSPRAQIAIQYNSGSEAYTRSYYNGTWTAWRRLSVPLSNSVSSTSSTVAASSYAAKIAYDKAVQAYNLANSVNVSNELVNTVGPFGVGRRVFANYNRLNAVIANGGTVSGAYLRPLIMDNTYKLAYSSMTLSGTWRNVSGVSIGFYFNQTNPLGGEFIRIA